MTERIAEPITIAETISATEIAEDLAARVIEELRKNCFMRPSDSYATYTAG